MEKALFVLFEDLIGLECRPIGNITLLTKKRMPNKG